LDEYVVISKSFSIASKKLLIRVTASKGQGYLFIKAKKPKTTAGKLEKVESGLFRLPIVGNRQEVTVTF